MHGRPLLRDEQEMRESRQPVHRYQVRAKPASAHNTIGILIPDRIQCEQNIGNFLEAHTLCLYLTNGYSYRNCPAGFGRGRSECFFQRPIQLEMRKSTFPSRDAPSDCRMACAWSASGKLAATCVVNTFARMRVAISRKSESEAGMLKLRIK